MRPCPKCGALYDFDSAEYQFACKCGRDLKKEWEDVGDERCVWFEFAEAKERRQAGETTDDDREIYGLE